MKKIYILLFILLLGFECSFSQSLTVTNIDKSNFPIMKASFYSFDSQGNITDYSNADKLQIYENTNQRVIQNISCNYNPVPKQFSSVFVVDVSNSMSNISDGTTNLQKAIDFASAWIKKIPANGSDCAITSFDEFNYLNQDFTTNKMQLLNALNTLTPNGGTNYTAGLLSPKYGALQMTKNAKYQPIIIFLTDGSSDDFDHANIIKEAQAQGAKIFSIVLGIGALDALKNISDQTGGLCYDKVKNSSKLDEIINMIFALSTDMEPCAVTWESEYPCNPTTYNVEFVSDETSTSGSYYLADSDVPTLLFKPNFVNFYDILPTASKDTTITVIANISDFDITTITSTNPRFKIEPDKFFLKKGDSIKLKITYTADDANYQFTKFIFSNTICDKSYFTSAFINANNSDSSLKVIQPNGGEIYGVGGNAEINWGGVDSNDIVSLEYSTDKGASWISIEDSASGLSYIWDPIPNTPSNKCLMKVSRTLHGSNNVELGIGNPFDAKYSPDNNFIVISGSSGIRIYDAYTQQLVKKFGDTYDNIHSSKIDWSPDGERIVNVGSNGRVEVFNLLTGDSVCYFDALANWHSKVMWNPVNNSIATLVDNFGILVINLDDNSKLWIRENVNDVYRANDFVWSPNGKQLAYIKNDSLITIVQVPANVVSKVYVSRAGFINSIDWSPDGNFIATGTGKGKVEIWNYNNSQIANTLTYSTSVLKVKWYDNALLALGLNSKKLIVTDAFVAGSDITIPTSGLVRSLNWKKDGTRIISALDNFKVNVFNISSQNVLYAYAGCENFYWNMSWNPDNSIIALSGASQKSIQFWDGNTGEFLREIYDSTGANYILGWDNSGLALFTFNYINKKIKVWNKASGYIITEYYLPGSYTYPQFNSQTSQIAVADSLTLKIYNAIDGVKISEINYQAKKVDMLYIQDWSKDGKFIVTSDLYHHYMVWDVPQLKMVSDKDFTGTPIHSLDFSKNGNSILVGTDSESYGIMELNSSDLSIKGYVATPQNAIYSYIALFSNLNDRIIYSRSKNISGNSATYGLISYPESNVLMSIPTSCNKYQSIPNIARWSDDDSKLAIMLGDQTVKIINFNGTYTHSDVSDLLWEIALPNITAYDEVDMGEEYINLSKNKTVEGFIKNTGKITVRIDSITIENGNFDSFSTPKFLQSVSINPGDSLAVDFVFTPKSIGLLTSDIKIYLQNSIISSKIKGIGVKSTLNFKTNEIDFGTVYLKTSKDSTIKALIENSSSDPVVIDHIEFTGNNAGEFMLASGSSDTTFVIQPNANSDLSLAFKPLTQGNKECDLNIYYNNDGFVSTIKLLGKAIQYVKQNLILKCADVNEYPDRTAEIPLTLLNADSLSLTNIQSIEFDLTFNSTLLMSVDHTNMSNQKNIGTIHLIYNDLTSDSSELLLENLKFYTALGNDSISRLKIDNVKILDDDIPLDTINGIFKLDGICYDGGGRLIKISDLQAGIHSVKPNPANDVINLEVNFLENDYSEIYIVNMLGQKVSEVFAGIPNLGTQQYKLDIDKLDRGVYILIMNTQAINDKKLFIKQ